MDVTLHPKFADNLIARETADAIEACVHCGFCLATCPTYLEARDERDSPRGRIYLIRDFLQTGESDSVAQHHIDRCLTCRSCESTCPSGVVYGDIVDGGRELLERTVQRPAASRWQRKLLRGVVSRSALFGKLVAVGRVFKGVLPLRLKQQIPPAQKVLPAPTNVGANDEAGRVLLLEGCVQRAATPNTNLALRHLLSHLNVTVVESPGQGCCGALNTHLGAREDGLNDLRRNIDAWWPAIEDGVDAIISTATGCGTLLVDYGKFLAHDGQYADKAKRVSELTTDVAAYFAGERMAAIPSLRPDKLPRLSVHTPCSQSHALGDPDTVKALLRSRGYFLLSTTEDHLCCGSAGSYSILEPEMAQRLRERKLHALDAEHADVIVTANVGCQLHLAAGGDVPVRHWLELVLETVPDHP